MDINNKQNNIQNDLKNKLNKYYDDIKKQFVNGDLLLEKLSDVLADNININFSQKIIDILSSYEDKNNINNMNMQHMDNRKALDHLFTYINGNIIEYLNKLNNIGDQIDLKNFAELCRTILERMINDGDGIFMKNISNSVIGLLKQLKYENKPYIIYLSNRLNKKQPNKKLNNISNKKTSKINDENNNGHDNYNNDINKAD